VCSSEEQYIDGTWVLNELITQMPFIHRSPDLDGKCGEIQKHVRAGGNLPDYMRYQWQPKSCNLAPFDRKALCRALNRKVIGIAGDSTSEHFLQTLEGLMRGTI